MSTRQEQIARYQQSNIETSLALIGVALDSAERMFSLNLAITRALIDQHARHTRDVFAVTDPQELLSLQAAYFAPLLGHGLGYVGNSYEIVARAGNEAEKIVERHFDVWRRNLGGFVDHLARSAPGGIGSAVNALYSTANLFNRAFALFTGTLRRALPGMAGAETQAIVPEDTEETNRLRIEHRKAA